MPRVPTLDEFTAGGAITQPFAVQQAQAPRVENFAPQQGADMARSLMQAGSQLSQIVIQQQNDINDAATKEADNIAAQSISKLMNDPDGGYLTRKGKSAVDYRDAMRNAVQDVLNTSGEQLTNDMQRTMYRTVAQRRLQMALQQIDQHAGEQTRIWNKTETTNRVANAMDGAISNWYAWSAEPGPNNPFTTSRDTMIAETKALVALDGFAPDSETGKAAVTAALTKMHQSVIGSMVAGRKTSEAAEYFKRNYNEIDPSLRPKMESDLRTAETAVVGANTATQIWNEIGPKNFNQPVDLFKMEEKARELFPNDPEKVNATLAEIKTRAAAWDKSESEFTTAGVNAVGQLLMSGKSTAEILTSKAFQDLPGAKQNEIRDALNDRSYTLQQRGYAAEDRAYTLDQRARTRRIQAEEDLARRNAPLVLEYSDPRRLQMMTRDEVAALWTRIGLGNASSLVQKWDSLQGKSEGASIISTDDLLKGSATKLGILPTTGRPNNDQALGYINYQRAVADRVAVFEATELGGRRKASQEEVRRIVQSIEMDKVFTSSFGTDKEKARVVLTPQEEVNAYVRVGNEEIQISQISAQQRALIAQALRQAGKPLTEQNYAEYWVRGGKKK